MEFLIPNQYLRAKLANPMIRSVVSYHRGCRLHSQDIDVQKTKSSDITQTKQTVSERVKAPEFVHGVKTGVEVPKKTFKTSKFDKWMVAWVFRNRFKSAKDVPDEMASQLYWKARSLFRIRVNIMMGIMVMFFAFGITRYGKYQRDQGRNLTEDTIERKERIRKEYLQQQAAEKAKLDNNS